MATDRTYARSGLALLTGAADRPWKPLGLRGAGHPGDDHSVLVLLHKHREAWDRIKLKVGVCQSICDACSREWQAKGIPTFRLHNEAKRLKPAHEKACRVKWPTLKLRRQIGVRRANCRNVPLSKPQACRANACGRWAFSRSWKWPRKFGEEATGAGKGTGIQHSLG